MKSLHRFLPALLGSVSVFALAGAARASLYVNQVGPNISYTNINESDSQIIGPPVVNSNPTGLFGQPILTPAGSDNLAFPALTFSVQVADGEFELQDGKLTLDIAPTSLDGVLNSLNFDEGGAWRVLGPSNIQGSDLATTVESTLVFNNLSITSVNNVSLTTPIVVSPAFTESATPQVGAADITLANGDVTIASTGATAVGIWDIDASFNLDAALAAAHLTGNITGVSVQLNNQLFGETSALDSLTLGAIDKKHFNITSGPSSGVPEPASVSLLLGAAGLMMRRRRSM